MCSASMRLLVIGKAICIRTMAECLFGPDKPAGATFSGDSVHYEYGKNYKYTYDTKILFNEDSAKQETRAQKDVGLRIRLEFDFTPIFQGADSQLIRLQVK